MVYSVSTESEDNEDNGSRQNFRFRTKQVVRDCVDESVCFALLSLRMERAYHHEESRLNKLKVTDLKRELESLGLSKTGTHLWRCNQSAALTPSCCQA